MARIYIDAIGLTIMAHVRNFLENDVWTPPLLSNCTMVITGHVAAAPGPLVCPSHGAVPLACPSLSARPSLPVLFVALGPEIVLI